MKEIVDSCSSCPFYAWDSDEGPFCWHGVELTDYKRKKLNLKTLTIKIGCTIITIPAECPLLQNNITVEIDPKIKAAII